MGGPPRCVLPNHVWADANQEAVTGIMAMAAAAGSNTEIVRQVIAHPKSIHFGQSSRRLGVHQPWSVKERHNRCEIECSCISGHSILQVATEPGPHLSPCCSLLFSRDGGDSPRRGRHVCRSVPRGSNLRVRRGGRFRTRFAASWVWSLAPWASRDLGKM